ncbi:MAG: PAS domain S-box protein [Phycisphaerae bacterium]|jgi:PAS domain S-box-containing protein
MKKTQLFKRISEVLSVCIFLGGLVALVGWVLDIPVLKSISPNFVAMKANTAIGFIFIGLSLWLLQTRRQGNRAARGIARFCAFVVFAIGFLVFWEYMLGRNFGIDQLLFKESATVILTSSPGKMAFNTSIIFVLIGIALFMVGFEAALFSWPAQLLVIPTGIISLLSFVGYLYGATPLYIGHKFNTAMALHTSVLSLMSCIGCLYVRPERGLMKTISSDNYGGLMLRRMLPVVVIIPLVIGYINLHGENKALLTNEFGETFVAISNMIIISLFVYILSVYLNRLDAKRKQTEITLLESESKYKTLFSTAVEGILVADVQKKQFLYCNPAICRMLGYTEEELMRLGVENIHPKEALDYVYAEFEAQARGEKKITELLCLRKDGTIFDVSIGTSGIVIDGRKCMLGFFTDITERKETEEKIKKMLQWQQGVNIIQQSLLVQAPLEDKLKILTDSIVRIFDADFCRIWLIRPGDICQDCVHGEAKEGTHICHNHDRCLHLLASSGRYTSIDGRVHRRVPFGCYKIGLVASGEEHKFLTNDVQNDPRVHNNQWARELGLKSFAGYQLKIPGGETLGVLALFAKHPILPAEDAMLDGLSSTAAFIVQQVVADNALRHSETKFHTLYDTTSDAVMLLNEKGFFDCNKATLTIFGCSDKKEFCSKHPADLSPAMQPCGTDSMALANQQIAIAMKKGTNQFEWVHKRADTGREFPAEVLLNAMELDGKPVLQAVVRDITARKQAEESLIFIKTKLELSLQSSQMGVWQYNISENRRVFDDQTCSLLGINPAMFGGLEEEFFAALHPDDREKIKSALSRTIYGGASYEPEYRVVWPDGSIHHISARGKLQRDDKGNPQRINGIIWDITERKQAEENMKELNRELEGTVRKLEETNQELKNFVYIASHDLKEPARKISTFGSMLQKSLSGTIAEDDAENLSFMNEGAERMTQMVEGLLAYLAVITKHLSLGTVKLDSLIDRLKHTELAEAIANSGAIIDIPKPLPAVEADNLFMRQLLHHLIINGIKYQAKGNSPHITITSKPAANQMVKIEITDNGIGIKPEFHQAIFAMFKRLHLRSEYDGIGTGLPICKKIVERYGGQIGVESQLGKGSTFWFTLPLSKSAKSTAEPVLASHTGRLQKRAMR